MATASSLCSWTHLDPNESPQNTTPKSSYSASVSSNSYEENEPTQAPSTSGAASFLSRKSGSTAQQHSATTNTEHPPQQLERPSSSDSSNRTGSTSDGKLESGHVDLESSLRATRGLTGKVKSLRSGIWERRWRLQSLENTNDEREQAHLKDLTLSLAGADTRDGKVEVDYDLLSNITKIFSGQRDERGPLQDEIRELEGELYIEEYKLQSAQEELHRRYLHEQQIVAAREDQLVTHLNPHTNRKLLALENEEPAAPPVLSRQDKYTNEYRAEPVTNAAGSTEPRHVYDPSRYDPKYAFWRQRVGETRLLKERLWNFGYREDKLRDRQERRQLVGLHLAKEDEKELERLPGVISKLVADLEESREEVEKLRNECLLLGIIDDDGEPVEKLKDSDGTKRSSRTVESGASVSHAGNLATNVAFEAWTIIPTGKNRGKRRPKKSRWTNSKIHKKDLSEKEISAAIQTLDDKKVVEKKLENLTWHQRQRVKYVCQLQNQKDPKNPMLWTIAQISWHHEHIGPQTSQRKVSTIIVYLRRVEQPTPARRKTHSSGYIDGQGSYRSSAGLKEDSMTTVSSKRERRTSVGSSQDCLPESIQQNEPVTPPAQLETYNSFTPLATAGLENESEGRSYLDKITLIPSATTNGYLDAETESLVYGDPQSRIGPWMLEMLAVSRTEVRLLATILQAMRISIEEDTALLVLQYWESDVRDIKLHLKPKSAILIITQAGYDKTLVEQVIKKPKACGFYKTQVTCADATHRESSM